MNYHIRRTEREITDSNECEAVLKDSKYAIVALCKNNQPYIVTLSYGYDKKDKSLYFHCAKEGQKIDFIRANPYACATIIADDGFDANSCEHSYKSLVIHGPIEIVNEKNVADYAIQLMIHQLEKEEPEKYLKRLQTGIKSYDNMQILRMKIESMTGKSRQKCAPEKKGPTATSPNSGKSPCQL
jgi:nitroimidazol reductase NimA-like FMN-containing flavoprotein (pyridoxamine 5'-phosphate oxidase superfamily)